jgi:predicted nucleic acid-binding protein
MKTALDTNILSAIFMGEPSAPRVRVALNAAKQAGSIVISPPAYAESLANPTGSQDIISAFLQLGGIAIDLPMLDHIWTEAGLRYQRYAAHRRQTFGEHPRRILADFLIGAHALLQADCLMTLDTRYYRQHFPELRIYPIPE